jgi:hypothetical protein
LLIGAPEEVCTVPEIPWPRLGLSAAAPKSPSRFLCAEVLKLTNRKDRRRNPWKIARDIRVSFVALTQEYAFS